MTEFQSMSTTHKSSTLPSQGFKRQRSFNSDTKKPALPPRPFTRSYTISSVPPSSTGNDNTAAWKKDKVVKDEASNELKEPSTNKNPKYNSLKHPSSQPSVETRTISKSFSDSFPTSDLSAKQHYSSNFVAITKPSSSKSKTPSPAPTLTPSPMPTSPTIKETQDTPSPTTACNGSVLDSTVSEPPADSDKPKESGDNNSNNKPPSTRPPPPNIKPPTRPSRPFPPPPQARLLEARLAKKKPPPPSPVTVIDTRTSPNTPTKSTNADNNVSNASTRDLKEVQAECSNFSSIPKRPPPPATSTSRSAVKLSIEEPKDIVVSGEKWTPSPPHVSKTKNCAKSESDAPQHSLTVQDMKDDMGNGSSSRATGGGGKLPSGSPQHDKRFVNKMKSSFRNLTQRRKNRRGDDRSPSSRRTVAYSSKSCDNLYDQERYPDKLPVGIVSPLVVQCVGYLNHHECLIEPGLFRIPGDMSLMKRYRVSFCRGEDVDLSECKDPHTIAGLLKLHFREQRQCVIPGDALVHKIAVAVENRDVDEFRALIESVDVQSQAGIRMLAELLKKIVENSDANHMTSGTLATSCGPSFFPRLPPSSANAVLKFMTDNCDTIFGTYS